MIERPGSSEFKLPINERVLTEVDHLLAGRQGDGSYDPALLDAVRLNLYSAVQEAAMPFAVTTTRHEYVYNPELRKSTFRWLGQSAVQSAMSGYKYHYHPAALKRVDVEIDEARFATEDLRPDMAKVFISPRMTRQDASLTDARSEHLADEDSVRVSWLETDASGQVTARVMQSLLIKDIPLEAWVAMLRDPNNLFGQAIDLEDPGSALSVMQVHRHLQLPVDRLWQGPISLVQAVKPYVEDPSLRQSVNRQLQKFYGDQTDMTEQAAICAQEWLQFELSLAESLATGYADYDLRRFIIGLQDQWLPDELEIIERHHMVGTEYFMSRELAVVLEKAKQNTLWGMAAISVGNEQVLEQLDPKVADQIRDNQALIELARQNDWDYRSLEMDNWRLIVGSGLRLGAGCSGVSDRSRWSDDSNQPTSANNSDRREDWRWKPGTCRIPACKKKTEIGPCGVCRSCQAKFDRGEDPDQSEPAPTIDKTANWLVKFTEAINEVTVSDEAIHSSQTPSYQRS